MKFNRFLSKLMAAQDPAGNTANTEMVWIYNNTGKSVFGTVLFHTIVNMSVFLFPGSDFDHRITGLLATVGAVIVTVLWGPSAPSIFNLGVK